MSIHLDDLICVGCNKKPEEIGGYRIAAMEDPYHQPTDEEIRQFVWEEEGTLNYENGHFLCDECYIKAGCPSSPNGWHAP